LLLGEGLTRTRGAAMTESLWPWLLVAGAGALHGLNPASGWLLAAGWSVRSGDRRQALRAVVPIAIGHLLSIGIVIGAVAWGPTLDRGVLQAVAVGLLVAGTLVHLGGHLPQRLRARAGGAALVLWSFAMSTAHGAGLALVPALLPLCIGAGQAGDGNVPGLLLPALGAAGLHAAAMLAITGLLAALASRASGLSPTLRRVFGSS
jgi:hypothetical protein